MEQKKNFKPVQESNVLSSTGNIGRHHPSLPIGKGLDEIGLQSANANGEAVIKKTPIKTKKVITTKNPTLKDYVNHKKIEVYPKVFIILTPDSKSKISNFSDFIEVSEATVDIVDIIPRLYDTHYDIIKHSSTRFMIGDKVIINFKYRSLNNQKNLEQQQPRIIKDIKFVALNDRTAVIAYLDNDNFYPINELDHYDTD